MEQKRVERLKLSRITADLDIQSRAAPQLERIQMFTYQLQGDKGLELIGPTGQDFPVVYWDGSVYWLADGVTRYEAYALAGRKEWWAEVREGNRADALLWSVQANLLHGAPATLADRRHAVQLLLRDDHWSAALSFRDIGRYCGLSHNTVIAINKLIKSGQIDQMSDNEEGDAERRKPWPDRFPNALARFRTLLLAPEADLVAALPPAETPGQVRVRTALQELQQALAEEQREREEKEAA